MSSEITDLVHRIERETMAMNRGLYGIASGLARHAFINRKMQLIGEAYERLAGFIGDDTAKDILLVHNDDAALIARLEQDARDIENVRKQERQARMVYCAKTNH